MDLGLAVYQLNDKSQNVRRQAHTNAEVICDASATCFPRSAGRQPSMW